MTSWVRSRRGDESDLAQTVALEAILRMSDRPKGVPNGLKGKLRGFSNVDEVRFELNDVLLHEGVVTELCAWERFRDRYSGRTCVSRKIASILRETRSSSLRTLDLAALMDTLERSRVAPADATALGRLRLLTEEAPDWEADALRERLTKLQFMSETREWVEAGKLLALHGSRLDPDEPRRHALAPPNWRLHCDYYVQADGGWPAVVFFRLCRQRMEAPAETIAQWVLRAQSEEARSTALEYIADGDLGDEVAKRVRDMGWLPDALRALPKTLTHPQVDEVRRRLASRDQITQVFEPSLRSTTLLPASAEHVLRALYDWWGKEAPSARRAYAQAVYPDGFSPKDLRLTDADNRAEHRTRWFTMFALACYRLLGRTRDSQHLGFIRRGIGEGWWQELAESEPPDNFQPWLESLERRSEPDRDDQPFLLWKRTLVDLYTIARGLDDHILLIRKLPGSIREGSGSLDFLLRPSSSSDASRLGADVAPINRSLGIGVNWLIRELVRHGVYRREDEELLAPHCWASTQRVRTFLKSLGAEVGDRPDIAVSRDIWEFVSEGTEGTKGTRGIGRDDARFDGDYDLPLQIVTRSKYQRIRERWFEQAGIESPIFREEFADSAEDSSHGRAR